MHPESNPYAQWLGVREQKQPPNHYALLGLPPLETDPQRIRAAAARQRETLRGHEDDASQDTVNRLLGEIYMAEATLLNAEQKAQYDEQYRAELAGAIQTEFVPATSPAEHDPLLPPGAPAEREAGETAQNSPQDAPSAQPEPAPAKSPADFLPPPTAAPTAPPATPASAAVDETMPPTAPSAAPAATPAAFAAAEKPAATTADGEAIPMALIPTAQVPMAQVPTAQVPTAQVPVAQVPTAQVPGAQAPASLGPADELMPPTAQPAAPSGAPAAAEAAPSQGPGAATPAPAAGVPTAEVPQALPATPAALPMGTPVSGPGPAADVQPATPQLSASRPLPRRQSSSAVLWAVIPAVAVVAIGLLLLKLTGAGPFSESADDAVAQADGDDAGRGTPAAPPVHQPKENPGGSNGPVSVSPHSSDPLTPPPPVTPPDNPPVTPPDNPPVTPPDNPSVTPPDNPPAVAPDAPDPQQMAAVTYWLNACRHYLGTREFDEAKSAIETAAKNDPTRARREEISRVQALEHYVGLFWKAVHDSANSLNAASQVTLKAGPGSDKTITVGVVEITPTVITLRRAGRNEDHYYDTMKSGLAFGLAEHWLDKNDPVSALVIGSFLIVNPTSDRKDARAYLQQAAQLGLSDESAQLMPELEIAIPTELDPPPVASAEPSTAPPPESPTPPEPPKPPAPADGRLPLPDDDALAKAREQVQARYKAQLDAAVFEADQVALAEKLHATSSAEGTDAATRFVLLTLSRDLLASAKDYELAFVIVDDIAKVFAVDGLEMKGELLAEAAKTAESADDNLVLTNVALPLSDEAVLLERYDQALRIARTALATARKSGNGELLKTASARIKEIQLQRPTD